MIPKEYQGHPFKSIWFYTKRWLSYIQIIQKHTFIILLRVERGIRNHLSFVNCVHIFFNYKDFRNTVPWNTPLCLDPGSSHAVHKAILKRWWLPSSKIRLKNLSPCAWYNSLCFSKTDQGPQLSSFHFSYSKEGHFPFKLKLILRAVHRVLPRRQRVPDSRPARLNLLERRRRMYSDLPRFRQHTGPFSDFFPVWPMIILKAMVSY